MKQSITAIIAVLSQKRYFVNFLLFWFLTVTLFIWAINVNLLAYILTTPDLRPAGKVAFILSAYANYFKYINNPIAATSILFSFLVAVNLTLLLYLWHQTKVRSDMAKQNSGAFVAMLGAHCLSCGTSFVAPLISLFAGSSAFISAGRATASLIFATTANLIGIALISWSIAKILKQLKRVSLPADYPIQRSQSQ